MRCERQLFDELVVKSETQFTAECKLEKVEENIDIYDISITRNPKEDLGIGIWIQLTFPIKKAKYRWYCGSRQNKSMQPQWKITSTQDCMLAKNEPVCTAFDNADMNTFTFAVSEIKKSIQLRAGTKEEDASFLFGVYVPFHQIKNDPTYSLKIRVDKRYVHYGKALSDTVKWWENDHNIVPMGVPERAKMPMYSTWYTFHQELKDEEIERQCVLATELGMKSVIVDDGWQMATNDGFSQAYVHAGDWNVCEKVIKNMKKHVEKIHKMGLSYILWFSVPYLGCKAKNYERFSDMLLYKIDGAGVSVLDPRYPEVREFLINKYEEFLVKYNIDGFKLDFIDSFYVENEPPKNDRMDIECVCDAVEVLMTDVKERLTKIKPDIMIEFRQAYIGPMIRKFGNMLRVGDCAYDATANRCGIADIRLTAGKSAVHSDMLMWHPEEKAEDAAFQLINSIFGVIQFSLDIDKLSDEHKQMSKFWLNFALDKRHTLFDCEFIAHEPNHSYPVLEAFNDEECIAGIYCRNKVLKAKAGKRLYIVNGSPDEYNYVEFDEEFTADCTIYDCMGNVVSKETKKFEKGVNVIASKVSGLVVIE